MDDWLILKETFNKKIDLGMDEEDAREHAIAEWFRVNKEHRKCKRREAK